MDNYTILVINPGSTSTKISVYSNEQEIFTNNIVHDYEEIREFKSPINQIDYRYEAIIKCLENHGYTINDFNAAVGRGGLLRPVKSGTYYINKQMLEDLMMAIGGEHPSNTTAFILDRISKEISVPVFIVDPPSVDEMIPLARISGFEGIERKSLFHALNIRSVMFRASEELGVNPNNKNYIIAHLGGGISIAAIYKGQIIDAESTNTMGPFSPERSGGLPIEDLIDMCYSGISKVDLKRKLLREGGVYSYLKTKDIKEVELLAQMGDPKAILILDAMVYQVAKVIGEMATVLKGEVNNIIITGGIARSDNVFKEIKERVGFIAEVKRYPGENEMLALASGAHRVLAGQEQALQYMEG